MQQTLDLPSVFGNHPTNVTQHRLCSHFRLIWSIRS